MFNEEWRKEVKEGRKKGGKKHLRPQINELLIRCAIKTKPTAFSQYFIYYSSTALLYQGLKEGRWTLNLPTKCPHLF